MTGSEHERRVFTTTEVGEMMARPRKAIEKAVRAGYIQALPRQPRQHIRISAEEVDRVLREGLPPLG